MTFISKLVKIVYPIGSSLSRLLDQPLAERRSTHWTLRQHVGARLTKTTKIFRLQHIQGGFSVILTRVGMATVVRWLFDRSTTCNCLLLCFADVIVLDKYVGVARLFPQHVTRHVR